MNTLEVNLSCAARENFRLFPQCYPIQTSVSVQTEQETDVFIWNEDEAVFLTEEAATNLELLAEYYGNEGGFCEAGMTKPQILKVVTEEFKTFCKA